MAARELGEVYWTGKGVPRDRVVALKYFEQAARAGDLDAAWRYALHRRDSVFTSAVTPKDRRGAVDALYWLTVVGQHHPDAKLRAQAANEVEALRGLYPDLVHPLDHRLYNDSLPRQAAALTPPRLGRARRIRSGAGNA